jgi:hypothetical protein
MPNTGSSGSDQSSVSANVVECRIRPMDEYELRDAMLVRELEMCLDYQSR